MSASGMILYHEVQESKLCGMHCVNTVLQGPYFSELDLAALASDLDRREMQMGMDNNIGDSSSSNVSLDGNFSIQVLAKALDVWDLRIISFDSREAQAAKVNPQQEVAFICHLQDHWFTVRKVGNQWYNFNSLYPAPEHLSNFYLSAFLGSLQSEGWSIFVVRGTFPTECVFSSESGNNFGQWLTPEDAQRITKSSKATEKVLDEDDPVLMAAIKASLEDTTTYTQQQYTNQNASSLAAAMAASLANIQVPQDRRDKAS